MRKTLCRFSALLSIALLSLLSLPLMFTEYHHALHKNLLDPPIVFAYEADPAQNLTRVHDILIKPYIKWHAATRQALQRATSNHRPRVRILVIRTDRSITHGLGDRFRGIMHSFICAVLSQRLFLIQWTDPISLQSVFRLGRSADALNFTYDPALFASNGLIIEGHYFDRIESKRYDVDSLFVDSVPRPNVTKWFNPPEVLKSRHRVLEKLSEVVPLPAEEQVLSLVMRALFEPTPELRQFIMHHVALLNMHPERQKYVSIHARLGYGLDEVRKNGKRFDLSKKGMNLSTVARCFADRAVRHAARLGMNKPLFYLATDTPRFRGMLEHAIENKVKGARVVSGEWIATHVRDATDRKGLESYMNAFLDIYLLSRGQGIIYLKSGFADLAAWMGIIGERERIEYEQCSSH